MDSAESELRIEQECRQQMQEASSSDREKLDRARRELASMKKIKQASLIFDIKKLFYSLFFIGFLSFSQFRNLLIY